MNLILKLKQNELVKSSLIYTLGGIILKGISFITAPIFIRLLDVNEYGVVSVYNTWLSLLCVIVTLQVSSSLMPAMRDYKSKEFEKYLSSILTLTTISSIITILVMAIFSNTISDMTKLDTTLIIIMGINSFFVGNVNFASTLSIKEQNRKQYLKISFSNILINIILSIIFISIMDEKKYYGRIVGILLASMIVGGVSYFKIIGKTGFSIDKKHWKYCLNISIPMIFHVISTTILSQSDRIMINNMVGSNEAGIYSFIYNIGSILLIITGATNNAWVPWYQRNLKEGNNNEIRKNASAYILVITIISIIIILLSPEIVKILATKEYWKGINLVPILILGCYVTYLYTFAVNYEIHMKKTKIIGISTTIVALVNIALNYILIPRYQAMGAAIATLLSYTLLFIIHQFNVRKIMNHKEINLLVYILGISSILLIAILTYIFKNNLYVRSIICIIATIYVFNKIINNKIKKIYLMEG